MNYYIILAFTISYTAGFGLLSYSIPEAVINNDKSKLLIGLGGLLFLIVGTVITCTNNLYAEIIIKYNIGSIFNKKIYIAVFLNLM